MAYGLIAKTANDTFTIDGSSSNYRSLQAQAEVSGSPSSVGAGELFFGRKTSGTGSVTANGTTVNGTNIRTFKATPANSFSTPSPGYGLKVLNQSGVVAYDSRNTSHGLEVVNIWAPKQCIWPKLRAANCLGPLPERYQTNLLKKPRSK